MYIRKIVRVGNSLHVSIPEEVVVHEKLSKGQLVALFYDGSELVMDFEKSDELNEARKTKSTGHKQKIGA